MFTGIQPDQIPGIAPELEPLIRKPLKRTKADRYHTVGSVLSKCISADWQCWVAATDRIDCVFITYITPYPTGWRTFVIYLVGGSKINSWLDEAWATFKSYAKANQCNEVVGMGREGWLHKLESIEGKPLDKHLRFSVEI